LKIAVIALTKNASRLANEIGHKLEADVYVKSKFALPGNRTIPEDFIGFVHEIFDKYRELIFVTAVGIAVRAIAGALKDKFSDPAVVVVHERGTYAISLLSGHVGGANELAIKVASAIGAEPIITTATDVEEVISIDMVAKECGCFIENVKDLKKVSAALVNGEKVCFVIDKDAKTIPKLEIYAKRCIKAAGKPDAFVYITDKDIGTLPDKPYVILRRKDIAVGLGCKRQTTFNNLLAFLKDGLKKANCGIERIKTIATIDIKKNEAGILELSEFLNIPLLFYSKQKLKEVEGNFPVSEAVLRAIGVGSVARPSAWLASNYGEEVAYFKGYEMTLAIYKCKPAKE